MNIEVEIDTLTKDPDTKIEEHLFHEREINDLGFNFEHKVDKTFKYYLDEYVKGDWSIEEYLDLDEYVNFDYTIDSKSSNHKADNENFDNNHKNSIKGIENDCEDSYEINLESVENEAPKQT